MCTKKYPFLLFLATLFRVIHALHMIALSLLFVTVCVAVGAFLVTTLALPYFQRYFHNLGVTGIDQQKANKPRLPTSGGVPVSFGAFLGLMLFVAISTFESSLSLHLSAPDLTHILAATLACFSISIVGLFDDLYVRRTITTNASAAREYRVGLSQWEKPLLTLVAAVPLMAVEAGTTVLNLPIVGSFNFGILYPLLLVPIGVICVSNAANMLAGYNGLEASMLSLAIIAVGVWSALYGAPEGAVIAFIGAGALLAFARVNWFPARMLPGDSLTYFGGAVFASAVILGNVEKFGIIVFTPWIIEAFLKLRGRFSVRSYGDLRKDGTIQAPYKKVYSLPHLVIKAGERLRMRVTEKRITLTLIIVELFFIALAVFIGRG